MSKILFTLEYQGIYADDYLCIDTNCTDEYIDDKGVVTVGDKTHKMTYYKKKKLICCGCYSKEQPCEHKICFLDTFKDIYNL